MVLSGLGAPMQQGGCRSHSSAEPPQPPRSHPCSVLIQHPQERAASWGKALVTFLMQIKLISRSFSHFGNGWGCSRARFSVELGSGVSFYLRVLSTAHTPGAKGGKSSSRVFKSAKAKLAGAQESILQPARGSRRNKTPHLARLGAAPRG